MTETTAAAYLTFDPSDFMFICEYCGYVLYMYKK